MTNEEQVRYETARLLDEIRPIAIRNRDTPIRDAAGQFVRLVGRAIRAFPTVEALRHARCIQHEPWRLALDACRLEGSLSRRQSGRRSA
jgi:hypothetical protein